VSSFVMIAVVGAAVLVLALVLSKGGG